MSGELPVPLGTGSSRNSGFLVALYKYPAGKKTRKRKKDMEGKCYYCGKYGELTKDHFYPKAIYKWTNSECKKIIESPENIVYACSNCNYQKQCYLKKPSSKALRKVKAEIQSELNDFNKLKRMLMSKQQNRCYCCHKPIKDDIIRRIDPKKERSLKNGCLVCPKCNNYPNFIKVRKGCEEK